jgi:nitrogen fixation protein NifU and related proteins
VIFVLFLPYQKEFSVADGLKYNKHERVLTIFGIFMNKTVLYNAFVMEHYHNPRYYGMLENPDFVVETVNASCGDAVSVTGRIKDGKLIEIKQKGTGCIISQASASIMAEQSINKSLEALKKLTASEITALASLSLGPQRLKCVSLALEALHRGIKDYA